MKSTSELKIKIRKAKATDISQWLAMRRVLWPTSRARHLADIKSLFGKRGFACFLAISENGDGKPVGFAEVMVRPFANGCQFRPVPFLEGLWVNPSHRRRGVGKELVKAIEAWALKRKFRELGSDAEI